MPIFEPPTGLALIKHFSMSEALTWGDPQRDRAFKERVLNASGLTSADARGYKWFAFTIQIHLDETLTHTRGHKPDIENYPKLIVDAFTDTLYSHDNLDFVKAVQVEGDWVPYKQHGTEVWIWGKPLA